MGRMTKKKQDPATLKNFGKRVRGVRMAQGHSQERLAELADLDRTYISGIERGVRNVSLLNISAIAAALKVSVSELTEGI